MGLFDFFTKNDINHYVDEFSKTKGAVLLDVRTEEENKEMRIPGSINIPLNKIATVPDQIPDKGTPLYVHCHSGSRSGQAVSFLKRLGYTNVYNIGGIANYTGKTERG